MSPASARFHAHRVYDYDRRASKEDPLIEYGLEGLRTGKPVTLYHGTTQLFRSFDMARSRGELNEGYYGNGIFLTPKKRVAELYANANRNIGFTPSIVADLKRKKPAAGRFLEILVEHGDGGWRFALKEAGFWREVPGPGEGHVDLVGFEDYLGVVPNDVSDLAAYIIGSKVMPLGSDTDSVLEELMGRATGAPDYVYDNLDSLGLDSKTYRPKVYTVSVTCSNPLVTKRKAQARNARSKGYDSVFFYGSDLVQGVPEVAVYSPRNVKIRKIEVV